MLILVLDGGHGPDGEHYQPGCIAHDGTHEAELSKTFCIALYDALSPYDVGLILTRGHNYDMPYTERKTLQCDVYICIHFNASKSHRGRGSEVFHHSSRSNFTPSGRLAGAIQNALSVWFADRGVKTERDWVYCFQGRPNEVLVEVCFADNQYDLKHYYKMFDKVVKGVADAIVKNLELEVRIKPGFADPATDNGRFLYANALKREIEHVARQPRDHACPQCGTITQVEPAVNDNLVAKFMKKCREEVFGPDA